MYKVFAVCASYFIYGLQKLDVPVVIHSFYKNLKIDYPQKEKELLDRFAQEKPDVFFFAKDPQLTAKLLAKIKDRSPHTKFVMWYGDQRGGVPPLIQERIPYLTLLLVNNRDPDQFRMYNKAGIKYVGMLYDCVNPADFPVIEQPRHYDVLFGGNRFKAHKFPLARLRYHLVDSVRGMCNMVVHGNGWPFPTKPIVRLGRYNQAMQNAKMTIGINHFDIKKYYEERIWHCMASGRMHLTHYVRGMEEDFVNRKHLVWFKSIGEARDLIRYYLKHDTEREAIGRAGRELLMERDTYIHRAKYLDEIFQKLVQLEG